MSAEICFFDYGKSDESKDYVQDQVKEASEWKNV